MNGRSLAFLSTPFTELLETPSSNRGRSRAQERWGCVPASGWAAVEEVLEEVPEAAL